MLPAIILKIVFFHDVPINAAWASQWQAQAALRDNFQNYGAGRINFMYLYVMWYIPKFFLID